MTDRDRVGRVLPYIDDDDSSSMSEEQLLEIQDAITEENKINEFNATQRRSTLLVNNKYMQILAWRSNHWSVWHAYKFAQHQHVQPFTPQQIVDELNAAHRDAGSRRVKGRQDVYSSIVYKVIPNDDDRYMSSSVWQANSINRSIMDSVQIIKCSWGCHERHMDVSRLHNFSYIGETLKPYNLIQDCFYSNALNVPKAFVTIRTTPLTLMNKINRSQIHFNNMNNNNNDISLSIIKRNQFQNNWLYCPERVCQQPNKLKTIAAVAFLNYMSKEQYLKEQNKLSIDDYAFILGLLQDIHITDNLNIEIEWHESNYQTISINSKIIPLLYAFVDLYNNTYDHLNYNVDIKQGNLCYVPLNLFTNKSKVFWFNTIKQFMYMNKEHINHTTLKEFCKINNL